MSHILKRKEDLLEIKKIMTIYQSDGLTEQFLKDYLELTIPKDQNGNNLIRYVIYESFGSTAEFRPSCETIEISMKKLNNWLEFNTTSMAELGKIDNLELLRQYLLFYLVAHEVEHSYQYLMGKGLVDTSCSFVKDGYKNLFELLMPMNNILPRPITKTKKYISCLLYKNHENEFVLERNANIEAVSLVYQLIELEKDEQLSKLFKHMLNVFFKVGYTHGNNGSMEETYFRILMKNKYLKLNRECNLSMSERIRYGLPIDDEARENILGLKKVNV